MKIHIDLDAFFAAAERTVNPCLHGIPIAVGGRGDQYIFSEQKSQQYVSTGSSGAFVSSIMMQSGDKSAQGIDYFTDPDGKVRGILTTASYEARRLGIKTPMPIAQALSICPTLTIVKPNFALYHGLSVALKTFLEERIPLLEQFSIDEFFGDLEGWIEEGEVKQFIEALKEEIFETFKLPVSIGAANSKWTAKMATTSCKPYGTKVVRTQDVMGFVSPLSIEKFPGIGRKLALNFHAMGFTTLGDIVRAKDYFMRQVPSMQALYFKVCGTDNEPINPPKERKSIGVSRTFDPVIDREEIQRRIAILSRHLSFTVQKYGFTPTTFNLTVRYEFDAKSSGSIKSNRLFSEKRFISEMMELFGKIDTYPTFFVKALSISVGGFMHQTKKPSSLLSLQEDKAIERFDQGLHKIRSKYGLDMLKWGNEIKKG